MRKENEICEAAKVYAKQEGYKNFKVLDIYQSGAVFPYCIEVEYDWIDPELHVEEYDYHTTWYVGLTGDTWKFIY